MSISAIELTDWMLFIIFMVGMPKNWLKKIKTGHFHIDETSLVWILNNENWILRIKKSFFLVEMIPEPFVNWVLNLRITLGVILKYYVKCKGDSITKLLSETHIRYINKKRRVLTRAHGLYDLGIIQLICLKIQYEFHLNLSRYFKLYYISIPLVYFCLIV